VGRADELISTRDGTIVVPVAGARGNVAPVTRPPVFVDPSGRRGTRINYVLAVAATACIAYVVAAAFGLMGHPMHLVGLRSWPPAEGLFGLSHVANAENARPGTRTGNTPTHYGSPAAGAPITPVPELTHPSETTSQWVAAGVPRTSGLAPPSSGATPGAPAAPSASVPGDVPSRDTQADPQAQGEARSQAEGEAQTDGDAKTKVKARPKPTTEPNPAATPNATTAPKPTVKPTPKVKAKATPKPTPKAKATPKPKAKATPTATAAGAEQLL
jgi:hypothetical protein